MRTAVLAIAIGAMLALGADRVEAEVGALADDRPRVLVSTDIGGTDPDDFQSMVHLLLYADVLDIEGLIASPFGPGRKEDILRVIDAYEHDYPKLVTHSSRYPRPDALRAITKQGAIDRARAPGRRRSRRRARTGSSGAPAATTRGRCTSWFGAASRTSPRRCTTPPTSCRSSASTSSAGRTRCGASTPTTTSRRTTRSCGSSRRTPPIAAGSSAATRRASGATRASWRSTSRAGGGSAAFFATQLGGKIKMGDSPSVGYLLHGTPEDPSQPGWGGRFVRVWDGRKTVFDRLTTEADAAEVFGVVEFALPVPDGFSADHAAQMIVRRPRHDPRHDRGRSPAVPLRACATRRCGPTRFPATSTASTASRAGSRPCRRRSRPHEPTFGDPSELVDRRPRPGSGRGRPCRREEREPMAGGFPPRLRRAAAAVRGPQTLKR